MTDASINGLPSRKQRRTWGRDRRQEAPRTALATSTVGARDPLGIIDAQNADRVQNLVPLRMERMATSPFAFYRGTAAIMASDLADDPSSGILVVSCGDAHVSNFGFFASPQRTLMFDLNDFDEAAWAPWEWDLKRLVTSVVIGGQATNRDDEVVRGAARGAVRAYARALDRNAERSPLERYYQHFDAGVIESMDDDSRSVVAGAIHDAQKRTADRAVRKLTERGEDGRLRFVERPPTMTHVSDELRAVAVGLIDEYATTTSVDIQLLLRHYKMIDICVRVVGVGSVGTRCFLVLFEDGDGNALILQAKEAGRSVLEEYGGVPQPKQLIEYLASAGQGLRATSGQRVLQALSDPFLGHLRGPEHDFYVRQFNDMKGGVEVTELDDAAFTRYAATCAITLARAHSQSPESAEISGYVGSGRTAGDAILEWSMDYARQSLSDYEEFIAREGAPTP